MTQDKPTILIDTGELRPLPFSCNVNVERRSLAVGHYSLSGEAERVAVDCWTLEELSRLVTRDRERLACRCRRLAEYATRLIVVERAAAADIARLLNGDELRTCGVPGAFAATPTGAAGIIERALTLVWLQQRQRQGIGPSLPVVMPMLAPEVPANDRAGAALPPWSA